MSNKTRKMKEVSILLLLLGACFSVFTSQAIQGVQNNSENLLSSDSYILVINSINMGGSDISSSQYNSISSIGQSATGFISNSNYTAHIGFLTFLTGPIERITVISPNGGEIWGIGEIDTIMWTSNGEIDSVKLEYSIDGGSTWIDIDSTSNIGSYLWTVPNNPSTTCRVKISDLADGEPWGMSGEDFTIIRVVFVSIPDTFANPNDTIAIPILVENDVTGLEIWSYLANIIFSGTVLVADSVYNTGTISSGWMSPIYSISDTSIHIASAGVNSPLSDSGSLAYIVFHVIGSLYDTTTIHFSDFMFNEGIPEVCTRDGLFEVSEEEEIGVQIPKVYSLSQNHPNPFIQTTKIKFGLPKDSYVNINVYNISGQRVTELLNEPKEAGYYEINWNAIDTKGIKVPLGVYFYRLETDEFKSTRKMILLR